jgi:hypothetical protein
MSGNRVSAYKAAEVMGVTVDAIRKRISRGTIPHERDRDGRVWVLLDTDQDAASNVHDTDQPQSDATALISAKDETIATLREQLEEANERDRENRRIIAALTSRIPAIEAPAKTPESPETVDEQQDRKQPRSDTLRAAASSSIETSSAALPFAIGAGVAAGVANPLLIAQTDNPLWSVLFVLWALPPLFGFWLGKILVPMMAFARAEQEEARTRLREMGEDYYGPTRHDEYVVNDLRDRFYWGNSMLFSYRRYPSICAAMTGTVTLLSSLGAFWFGMRVVADTVPVREVLGAAIAQGIVATMFVLFAGLIGNGQASRRHEESQPQSMDGGQPRGLSGNSQALVGLIGTIITAVLAFLGVLFQVLYGGGGAGG